MHPGIGISLRHDTGLHSIKAEIPLLESRMEADARFSEIVCQLALAVIAAGGLIHTTFTLPSQATVAHTKNRRNHWGFATGFRAGKNCRIADGILYTLPRAKPVKKLRNWVSVNLKGSEVKVRNGTKTGQEATRTANQYAHSNSTT